MLEGWHNDDYLVLSEGKAEADHITELYGISEYLPDYTVVGLRGWDDFIVADSQGRLFGIPTLPLDPKGLTPFVVQIDPAALKPDQRFTKKVKWYVKPILFGGDWRANENIAWLSLEEHAELVRWWNKFYRETFAKNETA